MQTTIRSEELAQWTPARPAIISEILIHGLGFLESTTSGENVSPGYQKATANILAAFAPTGASTLKISQHGKSPLDGSALLGAYFRSKKGTNGQPIISLTEEQIAAVHKFVEPIVYQGYTPQHYLDSFNGKPTDNHQRGFKTNYFSGDIRRRASSNV